MLSVYLIVISLSAKTNACSFSSVLKTTVTKKLAVTSNNLTDMRWKNIQKCNMGWDVMTADSFRLVKRESLWSSWKWTV